jgi:hypothetical protein
MHYPLRPFFPASLSIATLSIGVFSLGLAAIAPVQAAPMAGTTCRYNPSSGKQNPLGMRASVSFLEKNGDTTVTYEQLPSNVSGAVPAFISSKRMLLFPKMAVAEARQLMLKDPKYYNELLATESSDFAAMNALLSCSEATAMEPSPQPMAASKPGSQPTSIAQLPDGNYRFWSGTPTKAVFSMSELTKLGGALALIHKKGSQITTTFGYIDSDWSACVSGVASDNTITGQAFPFTNLTSPTTTFVNFGPSNFLRVRNPTKVSGRESYSEAILDLSGFSRINMGQIVPRKSCP